MAGTTGGMFDFGGGVNFNPGGTANPPPVMKDASVGTSPSLGFGIAGGITGGGAKTPTGSIPTGPASYPQANPSTILGGTSSTLPFYGSGAAPGSINNIFGALGPDLLNAIQTGGYNPEVLTALINQIQPQVSEGVATIGANTGANGTRFGSGYDLALGDYLSQVNLNENSMAAGLYQNAVSNSFGLLGQAANASEQYTSNKGGFTTALLTSLIGALGPTLIKSIPGLGGSSSGGSGGGIPGINNGSGTTINYPSIPTTGSGGGVPSDGGVFYPPTSAGSPNSSDPFGNGGLIP